MSETGTKIPVLFFKKIEKYMKKAEKMRMIKKIYGQIQNLTIFDL